MARKCKGLKKGKLKPGYKWPGGGKCPVKVSSKKKFRDVRSAPKSWKGKSFKKKGKANLVRSSFLELI